MKKTFLTKMISAGIIAATICTIAPLGVSAASSNWKQSSDYTWSYKIGNTLIKGWKNISNVWYYFDNNGKMKTGWINDGESGIMLIIQVQCRLELYRFLEKLSV